ncbi:MAG: hypothetical protein LBJ92_02675 [Holosporales bacterium]|nr:hypothetical protein [Holosporales bacterium]
MMMILRSSKVFQSMNFGGCKKIVILLHGYGSNGEAFASTAHMFWSQRLDDTLFIAPNAPFDCDAGYGFQWFKLNDFSYDELRTGLESVAQQLKEYIENIAQEYNCHDINLVGFSQGAIMSFEMLFHTKISRIISYSGMFAPPTAANIVDHTTRIMLVHSDDDQSVPYANVALSKASLEHFRIIPEIMTCNGIGHTISADGWDAGAKFLKS